MDRRTFIKTSAAALAATTGLRVSQVGAQSLSGAQSFTIGAVKVTALSDGFLPIGPEALSGVTPEEFASDLAAAFMAGPAHQTGVNAFLVESGDQKILVDAGTGAAFGPTLGHLGDSMAALGIDPASVTNVFATHLHPDHIGGLAGEGGAPFANAGLMVHQADMDFWTNDDIRGQAPEAMQGFFDMAKGVLSAAGDRVTVIADGTSVGGGLTAMHLPGHTPGHSGMMIDSDGAQLLIAGDILHVPPVQFARPEVTIGFDVDQDTARATRMKTLDMAAMDGLMIAGSHIGFPGLGHVEKSGSGYSFTPATWQYS